MLGHATRNTYPLALHIGTGFPPEPQGLRVTAELNANLFEQRFRVVFDDIHSFAAEQLDHGQAALNIGQLRGAGLATGGTALFTAIGAVAGGHFDGHFHPGLQAVDYSP